MTTPLDPTLRHLDDCGCCAGTRPVVPGVVFNRPGLSALAYRSATWHEFRTSMLAALASPSRPQMAGLATRADDDFSIALLDAVAAVGDVLTFYGERIANESYLRTASERASILELARLIGYELKPGAAASTWLAFTVEDPPVPVNPALAPPSAAVDVGVKVQSIPGHDEKPQTFETVEAIEARMEWNAMKPRRTGPQDLSSSPEAIVLAGTTTGLAPGDVLLLVAGAPGTSVAGGDWEARRVAAVAVDFDAGRTSVQLGSQMAGAAFAPSGPVRAYVLRTQGAVFGHNAADWTTMSSQFKCAYLKRNHPCTMTAAELAEWPSYAQVFVGSVSGSSTTADLDLDATYPIASGGWLVLATPDQARLYSVTDVTITGRAAFGISGRVTRVSLSGADLELFDEERRQLGVYAQGEELTLAEVPIDPAVSDGTAQLVLDRLVAAPPPGRALLLAGIDADTGEATHDEVVLDHVDEVDGHTVLVLAAAPAHMYRLDTLTIHGNVAPATHGESVSEVLGSGDAGKAFQRFVLRQPPLTWTRAAGAPGGVRSTLEVRVNGLRWDEVRSFYGRGPAERVYTTRLHDEGDTVVQFGDGVHGARLPTGQENVRSTYRRLGMGIGGNVRTGQLTTLLSRPLGIKEAVNPAPASGGAEPEPRDLARTNAPLTVLTMGRVVSLQDYEDFSRGYTGIAKALATWSWDGERRGVFVTVAGPDGEPIDQSVLDLLVDEIRDVGDPHVGLRVASYRQATFTTTYRLKVDAAHERDMVHAATVDAVRAAFGFAARAFGQPVALSDVIATIARVPGVVGVDVDALDRTDGIGGSGLLEPLPAVLPDATLLTATHAAELLTISDDPITPGDLA